MRKMLPWSSTIVSDQFACSSVAYLSLTCCSCDSVFKLYLDPDFKDAVEDAPSVVEAQSWYRDYLAQLYR